MDIPSEIGTIPDGTMEQSCTNTMPSCVTIEKQIMEKACRDVSLTEHELSVQGVDTRTRPIIGIIGIIGIGIGISVFFRKSVSV